MSTSSGEFAARAVEAAETINVKTSAAIYVGGIRAVTYALLDVAQAIREHARSA